MSGVLLLNVVLVFLILVNPSIRTTMTFEIPEDFSDPTAWSNSKFSIQDDLIDPTGWNFDRTTKSNIGKREDMFAYCDSLLKESSKNTHMKNSKEEERPSLKSASDSKNNIAFVRRFINLLIDSADLKNPNNINQNIHGIFEIKMSVEQYERLIRFSESHENISFGELDSILSNSIFGRNAIKEPLFEGLIDTIFYVASLSQVFLPLSLVLLGLFLLRATLVAKSISQLISRVFLVIFFVSYMFEFYTKYKVLEIEQMEMYRKHKGMPSSCSAEQSIWESFASIFKSKDDCAEYHKAVFIDPLYKVSPLGVLSCTFASMFTHPATMVGSAIADFSKAIFGSLPLYYAWFVYIMSIIGILVPIAFTLILLCGGSFRFGNLLGGVTISSSNTPLIASACRQALPSSSSEPLPQISSVNGSGNLIVLEANTLRSLLAAGSTNRIQEVDQHVMRSNSVPAELTASSDFCEKLDPDPLPQKKETDIPTKDEGSSGNNEDVCMESKLLHSKSESSLS